MPDRSLNRLLAIMPREAETLLRQRGTRVEFEAGDAILNPGPLEKVYFLKEGFASLVEPISRIELAIVTPDAVAGHPAILGVTTMPYLVEAATHVRSLAVPIIDLQEAMGDARVRVVLHEAVNDLIDQLSNAVVSSSGSVRQRLARKLLLAAEAHGDELRFTHDQMARSLAVRRPGITVALHELEGNRLIRSTRGAVRILDADGLRTVASKRKTGTRRELS